MARIDEERAAMFGGKGEDGRSNDLWVLNLDQSVSLSLSAKCTVPIFNAHQMSFAQIHSQIWTGPLKAQSPDQPWPIPCRFFSFTSLQPSCCSTGHWKQQILLLWGKAKYEEEEKEICHRSTWILEFDKNNPKWTEVHAGQFP